MLKNATPVGVTDAPTVAELVRQAAAGHHKAWEQLVDQYARLVWSITRSLHLSESDASDVSQTAWLRLLEHIDRIDPERVGAWLAVTTRRECFRVLALRKRTLLTFDESAFEALPDEQPEVDERLLADERVREVRHAMQDLPDRSRSLLHMLMSDPPMSYAEIADVLKLPIGSIGPMRGRCLEKLRVALEM